MPVTGLILPGLIVLTALAFIFRPRFDAVDALLSPFDRLANLPAFIWLVIGTFAFTVPLLEYWITAHSHGNALAGYFPWSDAREYYQCTQIHLIGADSPAHCSKRPYYTAFFTVLLWLSGNSMQIALLLQALIGGLCAMLFARVAQTRLDFAASLVSYAVLFAFAAAHCAGLVMTENAGLFLGLLGLILLWSDADDPGLATWTFGLAALTLALLARPGAMFVLPALMAWIVFQRRMTTRGKLTLVTTSIAVIALLFAYNYVLSILGGGQPGQTHSNFSYNVYGLVVGGKGWLQASRDYPELLSKTGLDVTNEVYRLALQKFLESPHLLLVGYLKGLGSYIDDIARYASEFKPLRFLFIGLWLTGLWNCIRRWREPRASMLLWLQAGILFSSPFIIVDETNRIFAASAGVDALLCATGLKYLSDRLTPHSVSTQGHYKIDRAGSLMAVVAIFMAIAVPLGGFAAIASSEKSEGTNAPSCPDNETGIVVAVGESALLLPLVGPGEDSVFPLRVRADHFARRFHRRVRSKQELTLPAGTSLLQGVRVDKSGFAGPAMLTISGKEPDAGLRTGFCLEAPTGRNPFGKVSRMVGPSGK